MTGLIPTVYPIKMAMKINCTYMMTPYAATPFSSRYFNNCVLNNMDTREEEILLINSDAPLEAARSIGESSSFVRTICNKDVFFLAKYRIGKKPPIH